ncbi:hypothetical protein TorRG33x02_099240 [Trema orientale]|uniref:Uncharacterized protein n=1 Tax=Trema orientale TaxID=63057 RepID=A0A2P5F8U0_TREOI|nr:hypothetical protein TorRG33x02_099240 [Trema orientale]
MYSMSKILNNLNARITHQKAVVQCPQCQALNTSISGLFEFLPQILIRPQRCRRTRALQEAILRIFPHRIIRSFRVRPSHKIFPINLKLIRIGRLNSVRVLKQTLMVSGNKSFIFLIIKELHCPNTLRHKISATLVSESLQLHF